MLTQNCVTLAIRFMLPALFAINGIPKSGIKNGRGTRDQIANICWIIKKGREFQKTSNSPLLTMPKPLTV